MTAVDTVAKSRAVLSQQARSFRWAAQFLSPDRYDDVAIVYAFCRLVDDLADLAPSVEEAQESLHRVECELRGVHAPSDLVAALLLVSERQGLDLDCAHELIKGVRSDLEAVCIPDDRALLRYCYRVAGTVGLMMCAVLGVQDQDALTYALDLGVGMQLTNMCRDVAEDASMKRVYLPATRLMVYGTTSKALLNGSPDKEAVACVVRDLLLLADRYYKSADDGMRFIPVRSRFAILVASRMYRAIGVRLRAHGCDALSGRTVVPWNEKVEWVARALIDAAHPNFWGISPLTPHDRALHTALAGLYGAHE